MPDKFSPRATKTPNAANVILNAIRNNASYTNGKIEELRQKLDALSEKVDTVPGKVTLGSTETKLITTDLIKLIDALTSEPVPVNPDTTTYPSGTPLYPFGYGKCIVNKTYQIDLTKLIESLAIDAAHAVYIHKITAVGNTTAALSLYENKVLTQESINLISNGKPSFEAIFNSGTSKLEVLIDVYNNAYVAIGQYNVRFYADYVVKSS